MGEGNIGREPFLLKVQKLPRHALAAQHSRLHAPEVGMGALCRRPMGLVDTLEHIGKPPVPYPRRLGLADTHHPVAR